MTFATTIRCEDRAVNVLVAEEDDVARAFLTDNLIADGYAVRTADSREQALARLSVRQPDVIVVDVNGQTLGLIDAIRIGDGLAGAVDPATPLIVLTARVDELHRIRLLDRGGDDVLAKPYSYPELRSRLAALLRRARASHAPRLLRVGELKIDLAARTVEMRGNRVELPAKEYELLRTLAREPTRVLTKVNFEPRPAEGKGARAPGARGGIGIPFPLGRLWPLSYQASRLPSVRKRRFRT
jgi:DNA-binding response OmpR family regulator